MAESLDLNFKYCYKRFMETFTTSEILTIDYRLWLCDEFTARCKRNPSYSIRSFSNLLKIDSSSLSKILSGSRKLSPKKLSSYIDIIGADPKKREALLRYASIKSKKNNHIEPAVDAEYRQMTIDAFEVISEWYHYAILELTYVKNFKSLPSWIASKLGVSTDEVKIAIERLTRLGLLKIINGKYVKSENFTTNFSEGVTSNAHKIFQKKVLEQALDAIDAIPAEEKDITSITMAIDEKKLSDAKKLIKKFRRDLCEFMEDGDQTKVYNLAIQLYPITKS